MIYYLFLALCAVLAAHVVVAIIGLAKMYREERRLAFFDGAPNRERNKILG
jgi:hypothetical protein